MGWNLEGMRVWGVYLGDVPVSGRVELSRVKYGGGVQHTVVLDGPIQLRWRTDPTTRILLDHKYVTRVAD